MTKRPFQPAVYIVVNRRNGAIYIGVTSDLIGRIWQHRESIFDGFTKRYDCKVLVWYEIHSTMEHAITRGEAAQRRLSQEEAGADRSGESAVARSLSGVAALNRPGLLRRYAPRNDER